MGVDCEACEDACPCIGGFPQLWGMFIFLLLGGGMLTGSSMYSLISLRTSVLKFDWAQPYALWLNACAFGVAAGAIMLCLALLTWCAFRSDGFSRIFKYIFAALLVVSALLSILTAVGSFSVFVGLSSQRSAFTKNFDKSWTALVNTNNNNINGTTCEIQKRLQCSGFIPGDCTGTRAGKLERCDRSCPNTSKRGCYFVISSFYRRWNLPVACTAVLAAVCSLGALIILTTCVTFNLDEQKGDI